VTYHRGQHSFEDLRARGALLVTNPAAQTTITVDPVAGDDNNDGVTAPIKTIRALFERLPLRVNQGSSLWINPANVGFHVLLKAGTHNFTQGAGGTNYAIIPPWVTFRGEYTELSTFTLDHYSGDGMHVWQPAGNPAWTVDQWKGKFLEVPPANPATTIPTRYPILGNGTHDLIVGWSPTAAAGGFWGDYTPAAGVTMRIVEHGTLLTGYWYLIGGPFTFRDVELRAATPDTSTLYLFYPQTYATFVSCKFFGASGWYPPSSSTVMCVYYGATAQLSHCLLQQVYGGLYPYLWSKLILTDVSILESLRAVEGQQWIQVIIGGPIHARDAGDLFFMHQNADVLDQDSSFHFINPMGGGWTGAVYEMIHPNGKYTARNNGRVVDGQNPGCIINAGRNTKIVVPPGFVEVGGGGATFKLSPPTGSVNLTMTDLVTLHGGYLNAGGGIEVRALV